MVFYRMGAGFITGVAITLSAHDYIYLVIANSFARPHWRYQRLKKAYYTKDHATDINLLDIYVKDTISSFFLFWFAICPALYKVYVRNDARDVNTNEVEDSYSNILKQIHEKKHGKDVQTEQLAKTAETASPTETNDQKEEGKIELPENRITFEDYEKFLQKLEREGRLDGVALNNPKEVRLAAELEWDDKEGVVQREIRKGQI